MPTTETYYSPEPVAHSREGYPVFTYQERILAEHRYVVKLPNGRAMFCDAKGRINPIPARDQYVSVAMLGAMGGVLLGGPIAGLLCAAGAVAVAVLHGRRAERDAAIR